MSDARARATDIRHILNVGATLQAGGHTIHAGETFTEYEARFNAAANKLALHYQPSGFTPADVALLTEIHDLSNNREMAHWREGLQSLRARIVAVLPPV